MSNTNENSNGKPKKKHKLLYDILKAFFIIYSFLFLMWAAIENESLFLIIIGIIMAVILIIVLFLKCKKAKRSQKAQKVQTALTAILTMCVAVLSTVGVAVLSIWGLIFHTKIFLGVVAVLWFISECYEISQKRTNWFIVIGTVVTIVAGIFAFQSYHKLKELKEDLGAIIENSAVSFINDKAKLELESDIGKAEKDFDTKLYITIGGAVLFCVGHIIKACGNKKDTVVIEKVVEVPTAESASIPDNTTSRKYVFCENCGEKLSPTAKFCKYCGKSTSE